MVRKDLRIGPGEVLAAARTFLVDFEVLAYEEVDLEVLAFEEVGLDVLVVVEGRNFEVLPMEEAAIRDLLTRETRRHLWLSVLRDTVEYGVGIRKNVFR